MLGVVIQIDGYDPVAVAAVTLRAASIDDSAICHLDAKTWWPVLTRLPTLRYDLFDGAFGGAITAPSSTLSLSTEPWPDFGRYALADARLRLWTGELGDAWAGYTLRFDGRISNQPKLADMAAQIDFAVDDKWLDTPLLATYAGTTGAEGPAGLKGQAKALALGAPRYISGKLIDSVNNVYQLSAYGPIVAIDTALERLVRFGAPIANYATYAALVAATIPAGAWATANAVGMARFGAPNEGQVSFLVRGDNGSAVGWVRRPGALSRRIALLSGGSGKIDDSSLNALDLSRPYNLSIQIEDQTTARDRVQRLAASVNAVAGVSWTGKLFVAAVDLGAPTMTLAADGSALPPVRSVQQIDNGAPWKKLAIGAEPAWTVHDYASIAFTAPLIDLGPYSAGTTYREGNIVQHQGSSWLYINVTPSSGNAPPALPTSGNTYWRVFAQAGEDGATGAVGATGAPGAAGANGLTSYFHTAYANSPTGSIDFTTGAPGTRAFIGTYSDFAADDSIDPNAYTWTPYKGPASFGLAARGDVIVASNALVKTLTNGTWNSGGGFSTEGFRGGAQVSFSFENATQVMAGLNTDPATNDSFETIDYAIFATGSTSQVFESGMLIGDIGAWSSATRFQIVYDNKTVTYYKDGAVVRQVAATAGLTLYFDAALAGNAAGKVKDINFVAAGAAGAAGADGTVVSASPATFVVPALSSGAAKPSWAGGSCIIRLQKGGQEITAGVTYAVVNSVNIASPTISGQTVSFADVTADKGEFTVRATLAGVNYEQKVPVTKVRDGAAAFQGSTSFSASSGSTTGQASVTAPGGRPATISSSATYASLSSGQGRLTLYWRNSTDSGAWNLLGSVDGSVAQRINRGTPTEPNYENIPGAVSASFGFTTPAPDKLIDYRADFSTTAGAISSVAGTLKLEVTG